MIIHVLLTALASLHFCQSFKDISDPYFAGSGRKSEPIVRSKEARWNFSYVEKNYKSVFENELLELRVPYHISEVLNEGWFTSVWTLNGIPQPYGINVSIPQAKTSHSGTWMLISGEEEAYRQLRVHHVEVKTRVALGYGEETWLECNGLFINSYMDNRKKRYLIRRRTRKGVRKIYTSFTEDLAYGLRLKVVYGKRFAATYTCGVELENEDEGDYFQDWFPLLAVRLMTGNGTNAANNTRSVNPSEGMLEATLERVNKKYVLRELETVPPIRNDSCWYGRCLPGNLLPEKDSKKLLTYVKSLPVTHVKAKKEFVFKANKKTSVETGIWIKNGKISQNRGGNFIDHITPNYSGLWVFLTAPHGHFKFSRGKIILVEERVPVKKQFTMACDFVRVSKLFQGEEFAYVIGASDGKTRRYSDAASGYKQDLDYAAKFTLFFNEKYRNFTCGLKLARGGFILPLRMVILDKIRTGTVAAPEVVTNGTDVLAANVSVTDSGTPFISIEKLPPEIAKSTLPQTERPSFAIKRVGKPIEQESPREKSSLPEEDSKPLLQGRASLTLRRESNTSEKEPKEKSSLPEEDSKPLLQGRASLTLRRESNASEKEPPSDVNVTAGGTPFISTEKLPPKMAKPTLPQTERPSFAMKRVGKPIEQEPIKGKSSLPEEDSKPLLQGRASLTLRRESNTSEKEPPSNVSVTAGGTPSMSVEKLQPKMAKPTLPQTERPSFAIKRVAKPIEQESPKEKSSLPEENSKPQTERPSFTMKKGHSPLPEEDSKPLLQGRSLLTPRMESKTPEEEPAKIASAETGRHPFVIRKDSKMLEKQPSVKNIAVPTQPHTERASLPLKKGAKTPQKEPLSLLLQQEKTSEKKELTTVLLSKDPEQEPNILT